MSASAIFSLNDAMRYRWLDFRNGFAINYGMGVPSLAKGLNSHPLIASNIIEKHRRAHPRFWRWRDEMINAAMLCREMRSVFGWPLRISTSPNKRTLYNFPMQSNGAEMLQLAAWRMCEIGIIPYMLIHDGLFIEARDMQQIGPPSTSCVRQDVMCVMGWRSESIQIRSFTMANGTATSGRWRRRCGRR